MARMKLKGVTTVGLFTLLGISLSGCLSLQIGGKTHNCNGITEAETRIAQLERRINMLEHQASIAPPKHTESPVYPASAMVENRSNNHAPLPQTVPLSR